MDKYLTEYYDGSEASSKYITKHIKSEGSKSPRV